ncbi:DNA repair protein RecO C-terminal domain-containing protein [uncultured Desulfovibrio sp.]|uniref:DNA repair protein RecO n=1 Tax=uncultured Desulfovibrio sp. TaxID=167968 RepID=UPI002618B208|nr:DNA repair protein RecO C-terminal domain-containing protein [uncultured Desulfovibrio sp.]
MEWTDQALVLRMGAFRESDLWLRLLCRKHGLLTVFAFGGSRSRRRFCGCLDVLNTLRGRVRSSRDGRFLNLEEATLTRGPRLLRRNWQRMGLAANCLRFVEAMGVSEDAAEESFLLMEDLREALEAEQAPPVLLPLYFRLRLAGALGFAPNLGQCGRCGRAIDGQALFVVDEGQLRCPSCRSGRFEPERYGVEVPAEGLDLLRRVQQSFPSAWPGGELSPPVRRACARAIDGFVQYHLGLAWEGSYFRRV